MYEEIKAEIERLRRIDEISDDKDYAQYELDVKCGYDSALDDVLSFIESLEKEQAIISRPSATQITLGKIASVLSKYEDKDNSPLEQIRSIIIDDTIESLEKEQPKIEDIQREWYNKGYIKGRKEAHIPARELGLPSSLDDNSPKIKGWVARCKWPCPDELYFYRGEEKPIRCGSQVEDVKEDFYWDFQHEVAPLDPTFFPDLKWEDEPIEVELTIHRV